MDEQQMIRGQAAYRQMEESCRQLVTSGNWQRVGASDIKLFLDMYVQALLLRLDLAGVAASSGSACTSGSLDPSHVLLGIGLPHEIAHGSLRLTLGDFNTEAEVDYVLDKLPDIVRILRDMSPLFHQEEGGKVLV